MRGNLFIITGPSGVGKTTVAMELLKRRDNLKKIVTCTTRPMRDNETNGVSYHFLDQDTFQVHIDAGEMFEWDKHYDHFYGSRKSDVETIIASGNDVLFVVDVQGAINIKKTNPDVIVFFLEAETPQELLDRIKKRDGDNTVGFEERMKALEKEMAYGEQADYAIVNKDGKIDQTVAQVMELMDDLDAKS